MEDKATNSSGGVGFGGLLQLALIVLKLCKVIDWKWSMVLLPMEIGLALFALILAFLLCVYAWEWFKDRKRRGGSR